MSKFEGVENESSREKTHSLLEQLFHVQVSADDTRDDLRQPRNDRICVIMTDDFTLSISDISHEHIIQVNGLHGPFYKATYFVRSKYSPTLPPSIRGDDFSFQARNMIPKLPAFKICEELSNEELDMVFKELIQEKIEQFLSK